MARHIPPTQAITTAVIIAVATAFAVECFHGFNAAKQPKTAGTL